jgi:type IV pilus assembly protein PilV
MTGNERGFSLLEVMLGMVIFMIGMLGVIAMQVAMVRGTDFSAKVTEAATLAANRLERLMVLNYSDTDLDDTDADGTNQDANNDGVDDDGGNFGLDDTGNQADHQSAGVGTNGVFNVYWNVAVDEPAAKCKTVRVIVSWSEKGNARQIAMTGVRTN